MFPSTIHVFVHQIQPNSKEFAIHVMSPIVHYVKKIMFVLPVIQLIT